MLVHQLDTSDCSLPVWLLLTCKYPWNVGVQILLRFSWKTWEKLAHQIAELPRIKSQPPLPVTHLSFLPHQTPSIVLLGILLTTLWPEPGYNNRNRFFTRDSASFHNLHVLLQLMAVIHLSVSPNSLLTRFTKTIQYTLR